MSLWRRWVAFWARREPAESLALFRILIGLCVLSTVAVDVPIRDFVWVERSDGGFRAIGEVRGLMALLGGHTDRVVCGLLAVTAVSGTSLTLGVLPRLSALICLQCLLALASSGQPGGSQEHLVSNALWLLVFARSDGTLSLSARLRSGRWRPLTMIPAWPRYLGILQMVLMYQSAGLYKLSAHWHPGGDLSALFYILNNPAWHRWSLPEVWLTLYPLTQAATLGAWLFELCGPTVLLLALYCRHTRTRPGRLRAAMNRLRVRDGFLVAGVAMHLGIMVLMAVGAFSALALAFYPCFVHPDELRARLRAGRAAARST